MALRRFAELPFSACASGRSHRSARGLARATHGIDCAGILFRYATAHSRSEQFYFGPAQQVGWLFLGIFGTMIPVLEYMEGSAEKLGLTSQTAFFWATGLLSALLDNAPTYLAFFAAALGLHHFDINEPLQVTDFISKNGGELTAISLGATFFGALTYIGNAPNLLVKTIAEHARVPTPSFVGYIWKFAMPILIPIFVVI